MSQIKFPSDKVIADRFKRRIASSRSYQKYNEQFYGMCHGFCMIFGYMLAFILGGYFNILPKIGDVDSLTIESLGILAIGLTGVALIPLLVFMFMTRNYVNLKRKRRLNYYRELCAEFGIDP